MSSLGRSFYRDGCRIHHHHSRLKISSYDMMNIVVGAAIIFALAYSVSLKESAMGFSFLILLVAVILAWYGNPRRHFNGR